MDFGAVLDEWDRLQKEAKRKARGGNPISGKKANAPEKSKTPSKYSEAENGFTKRIDPQEAWLRRYGVVDKDKIAAEEAERSRERSHRYVKDMPVEARIDLHGLTREEARNRLRKARASENPHRARQGNPHDGERERARRSCAKIYRTR